MKENSSFYSLTSDDVHKLYVDLIETSQDLIWQCDSQGRYTYLNPAWEETFGYSLDEMIGRRFSDFQTPEMAKRDMQEFDRLMHGGIVKGYETIHIGKNGHPIHLSFNAKSVQNEKGVIVGTCGSAFGITNRKLAEEALRESENKLRTISDNLPEGGVYQIDSGTKGEQRCFTYLSAGMARLHDIRIEDALQNALLIYNQVIEEDRPLIAQRETEALATMMPFSVEVRVTMSSGQIRWRLFTSAPRRLFNQHIVWDGIEFDITERKLMEAALRKSEARYRTINELISDYTFEIAVTADGSVYLAETSENFNRITGRSKEDALTIDSWNKIFHPDDLSKVMAALGLLLNEGVPVDLECRSFVHQSTMRWIHIVAKAVCSESNKKPSCIIGSIKDITRRKKAEEERQRLEHRLNQSQKLESLGVLAGGIAHDFNNLLGGIFGYIDTALSEPSPILRNEYLSKALVTIERTRALTRQLLTFAKGGAPVMKVENFTSFIQETVQFALSGASVSCQFDIPNDLWFCEIDKNQISQVIDNIVINAVQAMPSGGMITVCAKNSAFKEHEHPLLKAGRYVCLSIKDQGIGIPHEYLSRIFDPFYTTKPKGHGLGLATCYSIIHRHSGCIDVESEPGKGSVFQVFIPAVADAVLKPETEKVMSHKGSGTIIIMEDEDAMRDMISIMLNSMGYTTLCVRSGSEAIEFFRKETESKHPVTALILDLTIPGGLGGKETVGEIRKTDKNIPVFVVSGYANDPIMANPRHYGFTASICKPFRKNELAEMLSRHMSTTDSCANSCI
ncbi:MAG: PAS domain S-box protein [Chitinivibrionales bacterium]|nr:PAS domain S-box protein [Chitinivibrionales bacterium]